MTAPAYYPVLLARQFLYLREAQSLGQNMGQRINAVQTWSGGKDAIGTSWCAWFVTFVLDIAYQGKAPIPRMGSCQAILDLAKLKNMVSDVPKVGSLYFYVNPAGHAHHVGFVTSLDPLTGLAGNTSPDGKSANGDGVYEHAISASVFVDYTKES